MSAPATDCETFLTSRSEKHMLKTVLRHGTAPKSNEERPLILVSQDRGPQDRP